MSGRLKSVVLRTLGALLGRRVVLLPVEANDDAALLVVEAPYRVDAATLALVLRDAPRGMLTIEARGYDGFFPGAVAWRSGAIAVDGGTVSYSLDLAKGALWHGVHALVSGGSAIAFPTRRFVLDFALEAADSRTWRRRTGHYRPGRDRPVDAAYFHGDNYVDHDAESAGDAAIVCARVAAHAAAGARVLEVGCATGTVVRALRDAGYDAVGADFSAWAVEQARARTGGAHAFAWDLDAAAAPDELAARGPFDVLVLWMTLEHFRDPWRALAALAPLAARGATLLVHTTNADSLTRQLFGADWEGHFDWTHHGVEAVGVKALRARLPELGWHVRSLVTTRIWDGSADPLHATLRDWWDADQRFRALLAAKELGDFVTVAAVRA